MPTTFVFPCLHLAKGHTRFATAATFLRAAQAVAPDYRALAQEVIA